MTANELTAISLSDLLLSSRFWGVRKYETICEVIAGEAFMERCRYVSIALVCNQCSTYGKAFSVDMKYLPHIDGALRAGHASPLASCK